MFSRSDIQTFGRLVEVSICLGFLFGILAMVAGAGAGFLTRDAWCADLEGYSMPELYFRTFGLLAACGLLFHWFNRDDDLFSSIILLPTLFTLAFAGMAAAMPREGLRLFVPLISGATCLPGGTVAGGAISLLLLFPSWARPFNSVEETYPDRYETYPSDAEWMLPVADSRSAGSNDLGDMNAYGELPLESEQSPFTSESLVPPFETDPNTPSLEPAGDAFEAAEQDPGIAAPLWHGDADEPSAELEPLNEYGELNLME